MTTADYYRHARKLGPFRAIDALRMARDAAALDAAARAAKVPRPVTVWHESLPDGSQTIRFSRAVTVY